MCFRTNLYRLSRPMSPMPDFEDESYDNNLSPVHPKIVSSITDTNCSSISNTINSSFSCNTKVDVRSDTTKLENTVDPADNTHNARDDIQTIADDSGIIDVCGLGEREEKNSLPRDSSMDTITDTSAHNMTSLTHVNIENCGIPLSLFSQGYLCLPYLSLPYIDLLGDVNVRGYIVGATNVLFKQKRQLADVLIEIEGARIESQDAELQKQLHLTTADLRFADFVVKHVQEEKHDVFLDGVGWEGGDEWIRAQFRLYLLCLLRTSLLQGKILRKLFI